MEQLKQLQVEADEYGMNQKFIALVTALMNQWPLQKGECPKDAHEDGCTRGSVIENPTPYTYRTSSVPRQSVITSGGAEYHLKSKITGPVSVK